MRSRTAPGGAHAVIIGRVAPRAAPRTDSGLAARLAATASIGAGCIHLVVAPAHWSEWAVSGLFFVVLAACQLIWAPTVLVRTTPLVLALGVLVNLGAISLWAVSRTAGAPFGPNAGFPEAIHGADLCVLLLQIYVVMGAGWVWHRGHRGGHIPAFANAVILLGGAMVIALASTLGVVSGMRHDHHPPTGAEPVRHMPSVEHVEDHSGGVEIVESSPIEEPVAPAEHDPADHSH